MDRQAKSLKLVGLSREERRVKKERNGRAMKEYILCRWKKENKKRRGKKKGRKAYMATLGKIYHNFQNGSANRKHNFVLEDRTQK